MAYSLDQNINEALGNLFASTFLSSRVGRVKLNTGPHRFLTEVMNTVQNEKWRVPFNHFVPDIDYYATVIVKDNGAYYKHNETYENPKVSIKKYRMFYDEVIRIPTSNNDEIKISFGTKYNYYYY